MQRQEEKNGFSQRREEHREKKKL